ncbi:MAG: hypothetical protein R3C56_39055 [Pirellulaceae bacterium]
MPTLHRIVRRGTLSAGPLYDDELAESRADLQEEYDQIWKYREGNRVAGCATAATRRGACRIPDGAARARGVLLVAPRRGEHIRYSALPIPPPPAADYWRPTISPIEGAAVAI